MDLRKEGSKIYCYPLQKVKTPLYLRHIFDDLSVSSIAKATEDFEIARKWPVRLGVSHP
jgi:hypothetical protein